jgi:hypothetical protein
MSIKTKQTAWRPFELVVFFFFSFLSASSQTNIQPLAISNGVYSLKPKGSSEARAFCMDQFLETKAGNVYDRIRVGENTEITIGKRQYRLQDAIDKGKISITLSNGGSDDQMFVTLKNNTSQEAFLHLENDLVLSDKNSNNDIKDVKPITEAIPVKNVTRQQYVWFSHGFTDYIDTYRDVLVDCGILSEGENISIGEYLKRRNTFLQVNGVTGQKLVQPSYNDQELKKVYDYDLLNLLYLKSQIRLLNTKLPIKIYHIRYLKTTNKAYYFLDDGELTSFKTSDNAQILTKVNGGGKAILGFDAEFPTVKRDALVASAGKGKIIGIEIAAHNIENVEELLASGPKIEKVSEVTFTDFLAEYDLKVNYSTTAKSNDLSFTSKSGGYLKKIRNWFLNLIGKSTDQTMAEILDEAQRVADKAFPGQRLKSNVSLNYSEIIYSHQNWLRYLLNNTSSVYVFGY